MKSKLLWAMLPALLLLAGCQETDKNGRPLDNATSGHIYIYADESVEPLIRAELDAFQSLYKKAHVDALYMPGEDAIRRLYDDTTRIVITTRELNDKEAAYLKEKKVHIRTTKIAYDAVAIIVNNNCMDSTLTLQQLSEIMHGKIQTWKQLNPKFGKDSIRVVFDNAGSSTLQYLMQRFQPGNTLPANFYGVKSNPEVINYVEHTPNAMGVIGLSWISDRDDSTTVSFLNRIKVLALSPPDTAKDADEPFYQPYQAYIALRYYPLIREVNVISREGRIGLGNGTASFLAGNKGQLIVRLAGLLPAQAQVRIVNVKNKFDEQ